MPTKLQRVIEIVEDNHLGEPIGAKSNHRIKGRGSVLNANPRELDMIRKYAVPMDIEDEYKNHNRGRNAASQWKKWLDDKLSNRCNDELSSSKIKSS